MRLRFVFLLAASLSLAASAFPQGTEPSSLRQGLAAYQDGDWISALLFLRRAVLEPEHGTDETWYMLIMAEISAGEYEAAESDCMMFLGRFEHSPYAPYVQYQRGRMLCALGRSSQAVIQLSDFCHRNEGHELYASALYLVGECFFQEYDFDGARRLFERVVSEFHEDAKAPLAARRLEDIAARDREEKLLHMLRATGEEYLSAKEDYERQLRLRSVQDAFLRSDRQQAEETGGGHSQERHGDEFAPNDGGTASDTDNEILYLKLKADELRLLYNRMRENSEEGK